MNFRILLALLLCAGAVVSNVVATPCCAQEDHVTHVTKACEHCGCESCDEDDCECNAACHKCNNGE